jgi:hypothetical protein
MAVIRFFSVSFLAFLLLSPLIRSITTKVEKPIIVLLQDNSQSVAFKVKEDSSAYAAEIKLLADQLSANYEVKTYSFGTAILPELNFSFDEKSTNLTGALQEVAGMYSNRNLGAIIVATDGIFNEGTNPVYFADQLQAPVYTVGLGDTSAKRDLILSNVYYNRTVFLGDFFSVRAEWMADFCAREKPDFLLYEITEGKAVKLEERPVSIEGNEDRGSVDFLLKATAPGVKQYRLSLSSVEEEVSAVNNSKDIFIEVIEKRDKILMVAQSPHPDVAALKQSIEESRNYRVEVVVGAPFTGDIKEYSLVILHQLPAAGTNTTALFQQLRDAKKSVWLIAGSQTNIAQLNQVQTMLTITGHNNSTTDALPVINPGFTLFTLPEVVRQNLAAFPPLAAPFGEYKLSPSAVPLLNQKIGNVTTQYPLLMFQQELDGRSALIAGEGLWRWRMWDYEQHQNQEAFNALLSSIIQYLAVKPDERQFRVRLDKELQAGGTRIFSENESVIFSAELLNESNELINEPDAKLTVKNSEGKEFPFVFSKRGDAYALNTGYFTEGNYTWLAQVRYNNEDFTASGNFSVMPAQLEFVNLRANHQVLYALSEKTGGQLFSASQLPALRKSIEEKEEIKPVLYSTTRTEPLINLRWLLLPLLVLLALEWGIRKFNGAY